MIKKRLIALMLAITFLFTLPITPVNAAKHIGNNTSSQLISADEELENVRHMVLEDVLEPADSNEYSSVDFLSDELLEYPQEKPSIPEQDISVLLPEKTVIPDNDIYMGSFSELPEEVQELLSSDESYHSLIYEQKDLLLEYMGLRRDTMEICADAGYSIKESVSKALIMQFLDIGLQYALAMVAAYEGDEEAACREADMFRVYQSIYLWLNDDFTDELIQLLIKGYFAKDVVFSAIAAQALDLGYEEIVVKGFDAVRNANFSEFSEEEAVLMKWMVREYSMDIGVLLDYMATDSLSVMNLYKMLYDHRDLLGMSPENDMGMVAMTASSPVDGPTATYSELPFYFSQNSNEGINYGSGALAYEDQIAVIPGRNGLDLELAVQYSSHSAAWQKPRVGHMWAAFPTGRYFVGMHHGTYGYVHLPNSSGRHPFFSSDDDAYREFVQNLNHYSNLANELWLLDRRYNRSTLNSQPEMGPFQLVYFTTSDLITADNPFESMGDGWRLKFPRVIIEGNYTYLRMADGSTYQYQPSQGTSNLKNHPTRDIVFTQGADGAYADSFYTLSYHNGRKEYFNQQGYIIGIVDRFGNTIKFAYNSGSIVITDTNNQITTIAHTPQQVTVSLPDNTSVRYDMTDRINGTLDRKTDQLNRVTHFGYETSSARYNLADRSADAGYNEWISQRLLSTVTYPTGGVTRYAYDKASGFIGSSGRFEYYRLSSRWDEADGVHNREALTYYGCYTGHANGNPDNLPTWYTYGSTVLFPDKGTKKEYMFNYRHMPDVISIYDANSTGNAEMFEYDANKNLTKLTKDFWDGGAFRTSTELFTYDEFKNLREYWDTQGNKTTIEYPFGTNYGIPGRKTYRQDATTVVMVDNIRTGDGKAIAGTIISVNTLDNVIQRTFFTHDAYGNVASKTDYISNNFRDYILTNYTYSGGVFVTKEDIQEYGSNGSTDVFTREYSYDVFGRIKTLKDGVGNVTSYGYDLAGRLTRKTNPGGTFSTIEYNDNQRTMIVTDENGGKISTSYNRLGYPIQVDDITGTAYTLSSYSYDNMSRLKIERDSKNTETVYEYDYLDRMTSKAVGPNGNLYRETYAYDDAHTADLSRVIKTILGGAGSPSIETASYTNSHGFTAKTSRWINGAEVSDHFTYDYLGNQTTATDAENRITRYEYDGAGRLTKTTNPDNSVYQATYDWLGRNTTATDPKGAISDYQYNALGLLTRESTPFESSFHSISTYVYDKNGNLTAQRQTNNKPGTPFTEARIYYEYNNRDFLTRVISFNNNAVDNYVDYTYDNVGNTTSMTTANGTQATQYEYDRQNRLIKLTDPMGMVETYTYDTNNNLLTKTDRNNNLTTNTYDPLNRVTGVSVKFTNGTTASEYLEYGYAPTGIKTHEKNEKLTIAYEYDDAGRLTKQTETAAGTPGASVVKNYTYDVHNNRKSFTLSQNGATRQNQTYDYDNMNRLLRVYDFGALQATYAYDANGNRQSLAYPNGVTTTYAYNHANLVTSLVNNRGGAVLSSYTYTYLLDGNQDSKTDHEGVQSAYTYDGLGRLTKETELVPAGARGQSLICVQLSDKTKNSILSFSVRLGTNLRY